MYSVVIVQTFSSIFKLYMANNINILATNTCVLQFTVPKLCINIANVLRPQSKMTLAEFGYPVLGLLILLLPKTFKLFGFPIFSL